MIKPNKGLLQKVAYVVSIIKDVTLVLIALYELIRR